MKNKTIKGYYTTAEAAKSLGISKAAVLKAARAESWESARVGNVNLYHVEDIREYRGHRQRTKLVKKLGWQGRSLYRADDIDIECPKCGAFAVKWPAPPYLPEKFMCLEGHKENKL